MTQQAERDWVRLSEAPDIVGRSRRTIYRWVSTGALRAYRPQRDLWVKMEDLLEVDASKVRRIRGESG